MRSRDWGAETETFSLCLSHAAICYVSVPTHTSRSVPQATRGWSGGPWLAVKNNSQSAMRWMTVITVYRAHLEKHHWTAVVHDGDWHVVKETESREWVDRVGTIRRHQLQHSTDTAAAALSASVAARLVSDTRKFDRGLRQLMHVDIHWLDVPERVKFKLVSIVHNCLHHKAPWYLTDYCIPVWCGQLTTSSFCQAALPRCASTQSQLVWASPRQSYAVAGPTAWNSLSDDLRDPTLSVDSFRRLLKTRLFSEY